MFTRKYWSIQQLTLLIGLFASDFSSIYNLSEDKQRIDNSKEKLQFTDRNKNNQEFLNEDDITLLDNEVTEDEVLRALKASNNKSAPGLDDLPCEVYKVLWINIKT